MSSIVSNVKALILKRKGESIEFDDWELATFISERYSKKQVAVLTKCLSGVPVDTIVKECKVAESRVLNWTCDCVDSFYRMKKLSAK